MKNYLLDDEAGGAFDDEASLPFRPFSLFRVASLFSVLLDMKRSSSSSDSSIHKSG
jgi:hypothetical protein